MTMPPLTAAVSRFSQLADRFRERQRTWQTSNRKELHEDVRLILAAQAARQLHQCYQHERFVKEFDLSEDTLFPARDGFGDLSSALQALANLSPPDPEVAAILWQTQIYASRWKEVVRWMGENGAVFRDDWRDRVPKGAVTLSVFEGDLADMVKASQGERITVFDEHGSPEERERSHLRRVAEIYADACDELSVFCKRLCDGMKVSGRTHKQPEGCGNLCENNLATRFELAYRSFETAELQTEKELTDRAAYDWLKEHGVDGYNPPSFATWQRYVREGRKHYDTRKNTPRAGRVGRFGDEQDL